MNTGNVTHSQDFDFNTAQRLNSAGNPATSVSSTTASTATVSPLGRPENFVQMKGLQNSNETLEIFNPANANDQLNFSTFGAWNTHTTASNSASGTVGGYGVISSGQNTPVGSLPTTGTASYVGALTGFLNRGTGAAETAIRGDAALTANFGTAQVVSAFNVPGTFTAAGLASITPGTTNFSGATFTTRVTDTTLPQAMTGDLRGSFFGPAAQETGGTFTLKGGQASVIAAFGAKQR